jgi:hypothetical protein
MSVKDIDHLKLLKEAEEFNKYFFDKNNNDRGSKAVFDAELKKQKDQHEKDNKERDDDIKKMSDKQKDIERTFGMAEDVILTDSNNATVASMKVTGPNVGKKATTDKDEIKKADAKGGD